MATSNSETQEDITTTQSRVYTIAGTLDAVHSMFCSNDSPQQKENKDIIQEYSNEAHYSKANNHDVDYSNNTEPEIVVISSSEDEDEDEDEDEGEVLQKKNDLSENQKADSEYHWRKLVPFHYSSYHANGLNNVAITFTNVPNHEDMKMLTSFSNHFDIPIELTWSDRITHIVVTSEVTREFKSTVQIFNGVLLNCFIVTMKWIHDCLESGVLIKENFYLPPDYENESTFLTSLQVKIGLIKSPMEWMKGCVVYVLGTISNERRSYKLLEWMDRLGCKIVNNIADFINYEFFYRIILVDTSENNYRNTQIPSKQIIIEWLVNYQAVTLYMEWMFQCLSNYRLMEIEDFKLDYSSN
ncbi:uncharacterized protein LOC112694020 [Sipha flava]|uniref:Uncharacterized protein LOC112694020 n=2 Tax=Sipha flava TaxID=143950 RepID=A0A8B8GPX8_9HEMI|nr:uncharacterized protein LOC112694020 [Sipha flava]